MRTKQLLILIPMLCANVAFCAGDGNLSGFDASNLYQSHGLLAPWGSFAKIGSSLAVAGLAIYCAVVLRSAISNREENPGKLVAQFIGVLIIFGILQAII